MNGDRPHTLSTFSTRALISSSGTLAQPQPQCNLVKDQVLGDHLVGILHHEADELRPFLDRFSLRYSAPVKHRSLVFLFETAHELRQGRFAGSVLANDGDHLPFTDIKVDILQGRFARRHTKSSDSRSFRIDGLWFGAVSCGNRAVPRRKASFTAGRVQAPDVSGFHLRGHLDIRIFHRGDIQRFTDAVASPAHPNRPARARSYPR